MAKIDFSLRVTIEACATLISTIGPDQTVIITSEPGVGKTSILKMLQEEHGDVYDYVYVDCPVKDMMDIAATIPSHATKSLEYYVSDLFMLKSSKPKVIMLDEFMKAPKLLQIIFTRLINEHMVGDVALPEGSIVFGTSNNVTDGVGDAMMGHVGNRVTKVNMRKPTVEKWVAWAQRNGVPRSIRSWVTVTPAVMASYLDGDQQDNPYIFNPKKQGEQYASPRSLFRAGHIVANKDVLGEELTMAALAGTIGEAAARGMSAFVALEGSIIPYEQVLPQADKMVVPTDVSMLLMMIMEAVDKVESHTDLQQYMKFVERIRSQELVQSIFFTQLVQNKPLIASRNEAVSKWALANWDLLA